MTTDFQRLAALLSPSRRPLIAVGEIAQAHLARYTINQDLFDVEHLDMFVDELTPFVRELARQPIAFCGGFFSGLFRLDLSEDPVKSWLNKQGATPTAGNNAQVTESKGPKSIDID